MLICALLWLSACLCCCLPPYSSISVLSNVFLCRPFSSPLYFDVCHVCYRLLSSDKSSAPKPLPAQNPCSKILHHDWLLWRQPCPALPLWPVCPALPCPALIGGYLLVTSLWLAVVLAHGVVHQNMGFLLTGITSVRSVSMRSRVRVCPWEMTHPNLKRKQLLFSTIFNQCLITVWSFSASKNKFVVFSSVCSMSSCDNNDTYQELKQFTMDKNLLCSKFSVVLSDWQMFLIVRVIFCLRSATQVIWTSIYSNDCGHNLSLTTFECGFSDPNQV